MGRSDWEGLDFFGDKSWTTGNTGMSFQIWFSLKLSILNKKKELVYTDFRFRSIADIATLITDKVKWDIE